MIITKSISRFARNTVTVLKYVRELRKLGVGIFFELQNINTLSQMNSLFLVRLFAEHARGIYYRRTWTRSNGKHIVWQCEERYRVKGVIGCSNINLHEEDLEKTFVMAWNSIIENKEKYMEKWHKLEKDGNELEKLKARQFKELAEKVVLLEEINNEIVSLVLERVEVYKSGILSFCFLDGTNIEIDRNNIPG